MTQKAITALNLADSILDALESNPTLSKQLKLTSKTASFAKLFREIAVSVFNETPGIPPSSVPIKRKPKIVKRS